MLENVDTSDWPEEAQEVLQNLEQEYERQKKFNNGLRRLFQRFPRIIEATRDFFEEELTDAMKEIRNEVEEDVEDRGGS